WKCREENSDGLIAKFRFLLNTSPINVWLCLLHQLNHNKLVPNLLNSWTAFW
ncbi:MAG: hypothetical protein ACI81T_004074, partial [Bacteroidia bacterium]